MAPLLRNGGGRTRARTTVPIKAAVAVGSAIKPAMMPAAAAEAAFHPGQDRKAALLAVVQRLVERVGSVGDLLQCGCGSPHRVGALAQACNRITRSLTVAIIVAHRVH